MIKKNKKDVVQNLLGLIYLAFDFEKKTRNYGTDTPLTSSEIFMIKNIKKHSNFHITKLANVMGISKAAVSQMANKLKQKGMVNKVNDPENGSRYLLYLTDKGEIANKVHMQVRNEVFEKIYCILEDYNDLEVERLTQFITDTKEQITKIMNK